MLFLGAVIGPMTAAGSTGPSYCGDEGTVFPQGDLNRDCYTNLEDMAVLAEQWLLCSDAADPTCQSLPTWEDRNINAIQRVYADGVPHTNKHGVSRNEYDATESFLPIMMWYTPASAAGSFDWANLKAAGFNTVAPARVQWPAQLALWAEAAELQLVMITPFVSSRLDDVVGNPYVLGNAWMEDPSVSPSNQEDLLADFTSYMAMAEGILPDMLVFVADVPYAPYLSYWNEWNSIGAVSCQRNYVIGEKCDSIGYDATGIPDSVETAVSLNSEQKPMWFIVQACESLGEGVKDVSFPTASQLRAQVYAAIIHGATGIAYYSWDSDKTRNRGLIGISAEPQENYVAGTTKATPLQLLQSKALFAQAQQINSELAYLREAILSPTVLPEGVFSVEITGTSFTHTPIRVMLKPAGAGHYVLLTVNVDNTVPGFDSRGFVAPVPLDVTYHWAEALVSVTPLFENREALSLPAGAGSFTESYDPFAVHVYLVELGH